MSTTEERRQGERRQGERRQNEDRRKEEIRLKDAKKNVEEVNVAPHHRNCRQKSLRLGSCFMPVK